MASRQRWATCKRIDQLPVGVCRSAPTVQPNQLLSYEEIEMQRKTISDFHPEVLRWFDKYVHGDIDRRGFVNGVARYTVAGVTGACCLTPSIRVSPKRSRWRRTIAASAPSTSSTHRPRARGVCGAISRCRPMRAASCPAFSFFTRIAALNPHIEDIARRLALDNFVAFAPDALAQVGGYPGDEDKARDLFAKLDQAKTRADFIAAANYVKSLPECSGKIGVVGFCWGGTMANMLATQLPDLAAAVPFYGGQPPAKDVPNIKARLLHYAGEDERINGGWPAYGAA